MDHITSTSPLNIPELLVNIFDLADPDTLAVCARVCKHWSPLALEAIWGKWPIGYSQLLDILKPGIVQRHAFGFGLFEEQNPDSVLAQRAIFTKLPNQKDLERVQRYASWIKHLRLYESSGPYPTALSSIQFPNLQVLECELKIDENILTKLAPACGPHMKRILIDLEYVSTVDGFDSDEDEMDPLWSFDHYTSMLSFAAINFIAQDCSTITELDIAVGARSSSSFLKLLKPLSQSLRTLAIRAGNDSASPLLLGGFIELADFKSLCSLEIEACVVHLQCPPLKISGSTTKFQPFTLPSVRSVSIKNLDCQGTASILAFMPSTLISVTLVRQRFPPGTTDVRLLESALDGKFTRLEQLRILIETGSQSRDDTHDRDYQELFVRVLPKWPQLSDLQIYHPQLTFSKDILRIIEVNLTKLKTLAIFVYDQGYSDLRSLSKSLPQLTSLAIAPRIHQDLADYERTDWQFAMLRDFGGFPLPGFSLSDYPQAGSIPLGRAIEEDPALAERFQDSCRLGGIDPEATYQSTQPAYRFRPSRYNTSLSEEEESTDDQDEDTNSWEESDGWETE